MIIFYSSHFVQHFADEFE